MKQLTKAEMVDSLMSRLSKFFPDKSYDFDIDLITNTIEVRNKPTNRNKTHISISLVYTELYGNIVRVNDVSFNESRRRKGLFTKVMKYIYSLEFVDGIVIYKVHGEAMMRWCEKYKFWDYTRCYGDFINLNKRAFIFGKH